MVGLAWLLPRPDWRGPLILLGAFLLAGLVWGVARAPGDWGDPLGRYLVAHPETRGVFEGVIREAPLPRPDLNYGQYVLEVRRAELRGVWRPLPGRMLLRWTEPDREIYPGAVVQVRGSPATKLGPMNHGIGGPEAHYHRQGIYSLLSIRNRHIEQIGEERGSLNYWVGQLRAFQARRFAEVLPRETMPFIYTIWMGERGQVANERYADFLATGTAHILAVSGIHVGIVFFSVLFILQGAGMPRRGRIVIAMAAVLLFAVAAGARVSTLRAAIMLLLGLSAELVRREPDPPTGLGLAAWVLLLYDPAYLFDPGFLLSFSSVASLLLFARPLTPDAPFVPHSVKQALGTVFGVQVLPLPLSAHLFHVFSFAAPVANLLVVPALSLALWLCLGITLTAGLLPPLALLLGYALFPVTAFIEGCTAMLAQWSWSSTALSSPSLAGILFFYVFTAAMLYAWHRETHRHRALVVAGFAGMCTVLFWTPLRATPGVDFLDVGHGDAVLVRMPGNVTLLMDGGNATEYVDYGQRVVAPFLYSQGIHRLDYVAVSHADRDHIGGLLHVIDAVEVGEVWLGPPSGRPLESALLRRCAEKDIPVRRLEGGQRLALGEVSIDVLHPPARWPHQNGINDASLVLRVAWPGFEALLTGDIEGPAETALAKTGIATAILKAPHHGSMTSSSDAFLDAVAPRLAVISTAGPRGLSPLRQTVLDRYDARDIRVWRTDLHGGIRVQPEYGGLVATQARRVYGVE